MAANPEKPQETYLMGAVPGPEMIQAALMGPTPKVYANGFAIAQSSADVSVVLMLNNQPVTTVILSFNSAKSLLEDLSNAIGRLEAATQQKIKGIGEVNSDLQRALTKPTS